MFVKEFTQKEGISDYEKTFLPVAMLKSIQVLLSIAVYFNNYIWQIDIETAFLNDNLEKEIYMMQLDEFIDKRPKAYGMQIA